MKKEKSNESPCVLRGETRTSWVCAGGMKMSMGHTEYLIHKPVTLEKAYTIFSPVASFYRETLKLERSGLVKAMQLV